MFFSLYGGRPKNFSKFEDEYRIEVFHNLLSNW